SLRAGGNRTTITVRAAGAPRGMAGSRSADDGLGTVRVPRRLALEALPGLLLHAFERPDELRRRGVQVVQAEVLQDVVTHARLALRCPSRLPKQVPCRCAIAALAPGGSGRRALADTRCAKLTLAA